MLHRPCTAARFEQVIRENLDLGRPEEIKLIFNRRIPSRRRSRKRYYTRRYDDVTPALTSISRTRASNIITRKSSPAHRDHRQ